MASTADLVSRFSDWLAAARACKGIAYPEAMTLATVGADGMPSARIVLLKGHDARGFVFYTNRNSRKSAEIAGHDKVALCFYWGETGRQVRVEGHAESTTEAESDAYFASRPRESQLGAWASHQSQPLANHDALKARLDAVNAQYQGQDVPRPPHWGGWRVVPTRIEFWEEGAHRLHHRERFTRTGADEWNREILNP